MLESNEPFYDMREYSNDGSLMLVRIQEREMKSEGLPPTVSQCMFFNKSEIEKIMKVLNAYQTRNSGI
jgi:hypothetical protein